MANCDQCGNDYDKTFQVTVATESTRSTASSAQSKRSRRRAGTAIAGSLDMASSRVTSSIAAIIAGLKKGPMQWLIALHDRRV